MTAPDWEESGVLECSCGRQLVTRRNSDGAWMCPTCDQAPAEARKAV